MRARQQAVVDGQLVGEIAALRHLDRIDLADEVRDRDVRRGQLLAVATVTRQPGDLRGVAALGHARAARSADRDEGIVVDLAAGEHRHHLVEQPNEQPGDPRLGLPALAQQHDVLAAQHRVLDLGDDGLVVTDDTRQERLATPQAGDEVVAHLLLDRFRRVAGAAELADGARLGHHDVVATMLPAAIGVKARRGRNCHRARQACEARGGRQAIDVA